MLRFSSFVAVSSLVMACSSSHDDAPSPRPEPQPLAPFPAAAAADLRATLDGVIESGVAPGVAVVVDRPGYERWLGAAGVADLETSAALTPNERYRAGSTLKSAVAVATLQLVEEGRLSLDATLPLLLPDELAARVPDARAITLGMLLNHTSGIPEFGDAAFDQLVGLEPAHVWTLDELLTRAFAKPPSFPPGAGFSYSNTDYILIGEVLRHATGKSWREVVRERVFARLGMSASTLPEEGNPRCDGCARGYVPYEGELLDLTEVDPSMAGAAGGDAWITTPGDLATFARALTSGALFRDDVTLALMHEFVEAPVPEEAQTGYGLGLTRFRIGEVDLVGHLGGTAGFQSFFFQHPSSDAVVTGYMNVNGDFGAFVLPVVAAVGRALAAESER